MNDYLKTATNLFGEEKCTQQQVVFAAMVHNNVHSKKFSNDEKNKIKKVFLNWQNNSNPKINTIIKSFCFDFSHNQDGTWNSLDIWFNYCDREFDYYNKPVSNEILEMISDEFPF